MYVHTQTPSQGNAFWWRSKSSSQNSNATQGPSTDIITVLGRLRRRSSGGFSKPLMSTNSLAGWPRIGTQIIRSLAPSCIILPWQPANRHFKKEQAHSASVPTSFEAMQYLKLFPSLLSWFYLYFAVLKPLSISPFLCLSKSRTRRAFMRLKFSSGLCRMSTSRRITLNKEPTIQTPRAFSHWSMSNTYTSTDGIP